MTEVFVLLGLARVLPRKSLLGSDLTDGPCEQEMFFFQESSLVPILLCHCCGHCRSLCEISGAPRLAGWPRGLVVTRGTGHVSESMARISFTVGFATIPLPFFFF